MKKKVLLISALALGMVSAYGQNWESVSENSRIGRHGERDHSYRVDLKSFRNTVILLWKNLWQKNMSWVLMWEWELMIQANT